MGEILGCLFGIFVGITTAWYFQIKPMTQLKNENSDLRHTNDDLREDLAKAYKEIEMKDRAIECINTVLEQNSYGRDDIKLNKLKELVKDYQHIN